MSHFSPSHQKICRHCPLKKVMPTQVFDQSCWLLIVDVVIRLIFSKQFISVSSCFRKLCILSSFLTIFSPITTENSLWSINTSRLFCVRIFIEYLQNFIDFFHSWPTKAEHIEIPRTKWKYHEFVLLTYLFWEKQHTFFRPWKVLKNVSFRRGELNIFIVKTWKQISSTYPVWNLCPPLIFSTSSFTTWGKSQFSKRKLRYITLALDLLKVFKVLIELPIHFSWKLK